MAGMTLPPLSEVRRVLAATDRSPSADGAARWAATMAAGYGAELLLLQVILCGPDGPNEQTGEAEIAEATLGLTQFAQRLAGPRGRAIVVAHSDPVRAILDSVTSEGVDVIVVGNVGMSGRKQFLLGNIPNRVSHAARCTVVIVNTSAEGQRQVVHSRALALAGDQAREQRLLRRAWRIGRIFVKAGAREFLRRTVVDEDEVTARRARQFRDALQEAGPTFAKLGQILSTRPDLLPPVFIEELSSLRENVTPLTEVEVVSAMETAMGVPWEDVFASIEATPLAAGTIAQVHRATLESGERVVIKVQRPTAEEEILEDLGLLQMFADRAQQRPGIRRIADLQGMVEHMAESLQRELDFRQEASHLTQLREILAPFPRLGVPEVYESYSGRKLLVMEEIEGIPVLEAPPGEARIEAARQFLESFYAQVMKEGFFHADPHPGNLKWWKEKIYFLDLGMVGYVEPSVRELILMLLLAFAQDDRSFLADVVLALAGDTHNIGAADLSSFRVEVGELVDRYRLIPLRELQIGEVLQDITEISFRRNVRIPASLMLSAKAFSQMQQTAVALDPELDAFAVASSFVIRSTVGQVGRMLNPRSLLYELQKARVRMVRVVEAVEGLLGARPGTPLQVNFRGTERLEETLGRASRQLSLALGAAGALIGTAMTANSTRVPSWLPTAMGGLGSTLTAALLFELLRGSRGRPQRQNRE